MNARRKKIMTVLCLGSVFLAWRGYVLITERLLPTKTQADSMVVTPEPTPSDTAGVARPVSSDMTRVFEQQATVVDQPWGRDPFAPVPGSAQVSESPAAAKAPPRDQPPAPVLQFTGVSRSAGRWLAVVQNKIVRVDDVIDGQFTVVEITKRSLTVASGGWAYRYELGVERPEVRRSTEEP